MKKVTSYVLSDLNESVLSSPPLLKKLISSSIDHTLLKPEATESAIEKLCKEALTNSFYSVCIHSSYLPIAKKLLQNTDIKTVCVLGFPFGAEATEVKVFEAKNAIKNGADELDMVLHIGKLKNKNWDKVKKDIQSVSEASGSIPLKVILETCLLSDFEIKKACELASDVGASFVKTSTGFSTGGATAAHVALMRTTVGNKLGVKASGGIRTLFNALEMLLAGANRLGTSQSCQILNEITHSSYKDFKEWQKNQKLSESETKGGY